ncbi:hypothetical protein JCM10449v2_002440 [Rhodotorula kratochvilovae]
MPLHAWLRRGPPAPLRDGYRAVKDTFEDTELSASPGSSAGHSHETMLGRSTHASPSSIARSVALLVVGALAASVLWGGALWRAEARLRERLGLERSFSAAARELHVGLGANVTAARRYGPRRRQPHTWREGFRTPGPKELLTKAAPAKSLYDGLRPDLRYLVGDAWSGMTGQFLTCLSLIYLAQRTQRVAVLPSPWRDDEHYDNSFAKMSDLFNLEQFRQDTGTLVVELADVKQFDLEGRKTKRDDVGCYHGNNWATDGRTFPAFNLKASSWPIQRIGGWANDAVESFILFDMDPVFRHQSTERFAAREGRTIPRNMRDSQLLCYDNVWSLREVSMYRDGWWPHFYLTAEGLQEEKGGMMDLLNPEHRGMHPEWWAIGQYLDFQPEIWDVALLAAHQTLNVTDIPHNLLTVHIRRGDFVTWCPSGHDCVPSLDAYGTAVTSQLSHLPPHTPVLVTTDDTSASFLASLRALGWYPVDHAALGTADLLTARYGAREQGWYASAVDQAIHSLGSAFVGTEDSQVSLVAALRVAAWNGGRSEMVQRPK